MKIQPASIRFSSLFTFLVLACTFCCVVPAAAAQTQVGISGGELFSEGILEVGRPVTVRFDLKGYEIPRGAYASVNSVFLKRPDGERPLVTPGYPKTVMTFRTPGTYRLLLILSEVTKSSCGGVNAVTLLESEVELVIEPGGE